MIKSNLTLMLLLTTIVGRANAQQVITYTFEGEVGLTFHGPDPILGFDQSGALTLVPNVWSSVSEGDPIRALFRMNSSSAAECWNSECDVSRVYEDTVLSTEFSIGSVFGTNILHSSLFVRNNEPYQSSQAPPSCTDSYLWGNSFDFGPGVFIVNLNNRQAGSCPNSTFDSFELPTSLDLDDFPQAGANNWGFTLMFGIQYEENVLGRITHVSIAITADDCADAVALPSTFATTLYDASFATTDGSDATGFCDYGPLGDDQNYNDIWFTYTPDVGGCTHITTRNLAGYDTRLTVYDSASCPDDPSNIIACTDNEDQPAMPPFEAGLDVSLVAGETYMIRLGTYDDATLAHGGAIKISPGPGADLHSSGANPGAHGCVAFDEFCNGDGGDQAGCTDCPCGNNSPAGTIGGCLNSSGRGARLVASGDPSVSLPIGSASDLRFGATAVTPNSLCVLNSGDALAPTNPSNACFGLDSGIVDSVFDGLRCTVSNTQSHDGRSSDLAGEVGTTPNPWGGEANPADGIVVAAGFGAGQTRFFQVIHRDSVAVNCMTGLSTSQAIRVTFAP